MIKSNSKQQVKSKNKNEKEEKEILKASFGKVVRVLKVFHIQSVNNS